MMKHIKKAVMFSLMLNMNMSFCAMSPQLISQISDQAIMQSSSIANIIKYGREVFSGLTFYSLSSTCDYPAHPGHGLSYSESYSQHFRKRCTIERLSKHINERFLEVLPDSYFYELRVGAAIVNHLKLSRVLFDDKAVMKKLNEIEENCIPILRRNGYRGWNDELIEDLHEENAYFAKLVDSIMITQTSWENLKASNIDDFFKWHERPLKKTKIGMYIHLAVMKRYAKKFNIQYYDETKLMKHMLNRVISNVAYDKAELELLLKTDSFYTLKDNKAIQVAASQRIKELEEKEEKVRKEAEKEKKLRQDL